MRINNNIAALTSYTNLLRTGRDMHRSVGRLSSGYRINSVADDIAGHAISSKLANQIRGMSMASRNSLDGISLVGTAEGALTEVHNMLHRIRELAIQSANDSNEPEDRYKMQLEVEELFNELRDIAYKTEFNTIKILAGEAERFERTGDEPDDFNFPGLRLQIGANARMTMTVNIPDIRRIISEVAERHFPGQFFLAEEIDPVLAPLREARDTARAAYEEARRALDAADPDDPNYGDLEQAVLDTLHEWEEARDEFNEARADFDPQDTALHFLENEEWPVLNEDGVPVMFRADSMGVLVPDPSGTHFVLTENFRPGGDPEEDAGWNHRMFRVNVLTVANATTTIRFADDAIAAISHVRARLGAYENRLRHTEANLNATNEHTKGALSRIRDTDMALEMTNNVKYGIIQQAAISILGQANQRPQQILQLLH